MRSSQELIEVINQYEADGEDLCELGEEVTLLAQTLIASGSLTEALSLMEVYAEEAEWPNYGSDGYWAEHTQVVDIMLNLGMNYEGVDAGSVLFAFSEEGNFPLYFEIGATINSLLQGGEIESILENLTNGEPCDSFGLEEQFIVVGLFFNQNLTDEVFAKYFHLMDSETLEYILSIGKGAVNSWGWDFEYVQEFLARASNSKSGQMRIADFIKNMKDDFITPRVQFSDLRWESKEKYFADEYEYANLEELMSAGKSALPRIDIQESIELNNKGHQAFKSGDASTALDYWKQASDMGQPNAITSLVWLLSFLNGFEQAERVLDGYFDRSNRWRDQFDSLTGDPSIGTQFDSQRPAVFYNSALASWLSGESTDYLGFLAMADDSVEPVFLRKIIDGIEVSQMGLTHNQVDELIDIYECAIENFERIEEFDSSLIETWDGKTLAQFATESIVMLREFQPINVTDAVVTHDPDPVNLDVATDDTGRPTFGEFAERMQNAVDGERGDIRQIARLGMRIFSQHEELEDHEEDGWDMDSLWFDVVEVGISQILSEPGALGNSDLMDAILLFSEYDSHLLCLLLAQDSDRNQIGQETLTRISNSEPCGHDNGRSDSCIGWPIRLALHRNTSVDVLSNLNDYEDHSDVDSVKWALALNPSTPIHILQNYATSDSYGWRIQGEIEEFGISEVSIDEVSYEIQSFLRWAVAGNSSLPVQERDALANITASEIKCPDSVDVEVLSSEIRTRVAIQDQNTAQDLDLDESFETFMSDYYAMNPGLDPATPINELRTLAESSNERIQCNVAQNQATPIDALTSLSKSPLSEVRIGVARNSSTPFEILFGLASDSEVKVRRALGENSGFYPEIWEKLIVDSDPEVRSSLAKNSVIDDKSARILSADIEGIVRRHISKRNSVSSEVFEMLINDKDVWVRRNLAANTSVSHDILSALALDEDIDVRKAVTSNPNTPIETLIFLGEDTMKVACDPNTQPETLRNLAQENDNEVREAVAQNPNTPLDVLVELSADESWEVRFEVACNPNTPVEVLVVLAQDDSDVGNGCFDVRLAVAANPNTPLEIVEAIENDE